MRRTIDLPPLPIPDTKDPRLPKIPDIDIPASEEIQYPKLTKEFITRHDIELIESDERQLMLRMEELARIEGLRELTSTAERPTTYTTQADVDSKADDQHVVKRDGTTPLTGNWDAGDFEIKAETLESDVTTGTSPVTVASTTKVTNLNADQVDGYDLTGAPALLADIVCHEDAVVCHENEVVTV